MQFASQIAVLGGLRPPRPPARGVPRLRRGFFFGYWGGFAPPGPPSHRCFASIGGLRPPVIPGACSPRTPARGSGALRAPISFLYTGGLRPPGPPPVPGPFGARRVLEGRPGPQPFGLLAGPRVGRSRSKDPSGPSIARLIFCGAIAPRGGGEGVSPSPLVTAGLRPACDECGLSQGDNPACLLQTGSFAPRLQQARRSLSEGAAQSRSNPRRAPGSPPKGVKGPE